jgi:hypothetical protein
MAERPGRPGNRQAYGLPDPRQPRGAKRYSRFHSHGIGSVLRVVAFS